MEEALQAVLAHFPPLVFPSEQTHPFPGAQTDFDWFVVARGYFLDHTQLFTIAGLLYCPTVFILVKLMKGLPSLDGVLWLPLVLWNFLAAGFSAVGTYYTAPLLYRLFLKHTSDPITVLCDASCYLSADAARWVFYFNASKIFEWIDTGFLIFRKRDIGFLHWFHHILTFLYCWHASIYSYAADCSGMFFASMNLFVHALMYFYYGLAALGFKPSWGSVVTFIQTLQMFIGTAIVILSFQHCAATWEQNWHGLMLCGFMYLVYLYLFSKLLLGRLFRGKGGAKGASGKSDSKAKLRKKD